LRRNARNRRRRAIRDLQLQALSDQSSAHESSSDGSIQSDSGNESVIIHHYHNANADAGYGHQHGLDEHYDHQHGLDEMGHILDEQDAQHHRDDNVVELVQAHANIDEDANDEGGSDESESINSSRGDEGSDSDARGDDFDPELYLLDTLRDWAKRNVSKRKVDDLLKRLSVIHPGLPRSYKTLLSTPAHTDIIEIDNGSVWYKGVRTSLSQRITPEYIAAHGRVVIDVNLDGLPLYRSSSRTHFWPILGSLEGQSSEPFIIGYFGEEPNRKRRRKREKQKSIAEAWRVMVGVGAGLYYTQWH